MSQELYLMRSKNAAGGSKFISVVNPERANTRFSGAKKRAIIAAIEDTYTEGVYQTKKGYIKRQLLNGCAEYLEKDPETGEYFFY